MSSITLYSYRINELDLVKKREHLFLDNKTMNRKEFVAHKGMDNKFNICLRDQDRKKQNIYNTQIRADVIKYANNERVLTRYAQPGLEQGQAELILAEADLNNLSPGQYKISFKFLEDNGTTTPVFSDYNGGVLCTLIIKEDANPSPVSTQIANVWSQTGNTNNGDASNVFLSGNFAGNKTYNFNNSNHTIGIYATNFTGNVFVEGSLGIEAPSSNDDNWATIDILGTSIGRLPLANVSGPVYYNFTGNFNYLRFKYSPSSTNSGSFDKILIRN